METFINFLDNIGYSILSVIVVLIFGILIIKNILKQIKVILIASTMPRNRLTSAPRSHFGRG